MSGRGQGLDREVCHVGQGTGVRQRSLSCRAGDRS